MPADRAMPTRSPIRQEPTPRRRQEASTTTFSISHWSARQRAITNPRIWPKSFSAMRMTRSPVGESKSEWYCDSVQCAALDDSCSNLRICKISELVASRSCTKSPLRKQKELGIRAPYVICIERCRIDSVTSQYFLEPDTAD